MPCQFHEPKNDQKRPELRQVVSSSLQNAKPIGGPLSHPDMEHAFPCLLLVLRLSALCVLWVLYLLSLLPVAPALWPSLHWYLLSSSASLHHVLHVGSVLEVLVESADMAANIFVRLKAEGNHRNKAEGEPFPALVDARREVAAVLALRGDIFVPF